ncbi:MAG: RNA polymerase sigma factor [Acidobacteria bacterium]|nr:RNA polymerase sigma factor [Acidobacteriota bacterium]
MFTRDLTLSDVDQLQAGAPSAAAALGTPGELVEAFQMDEDTFRAFYDRTARALWLYLARLTGSSSLADDLLQESYYRFLRAARTYESEAHQRNSLFRIATNLAHDNRRRVRTAASVPLQDEEEHPGLQADHQSAQRAERRSDLARAMARLKPRERAMLWLAYAHGSSHGEIAEALGVTKGSVKLLLFRARRKLAAFLAGAPARNGEARS